jgi:hypothetical protein
MKSRHLLSFALVAVTAAMLASSAGSTPRHDGMLYGCVYVENLGSSSNLDVITWDKHAPHAHGWAMISGGGMNKTDKFQLDQHGWHIDKFNVTSFGTYKFTVGLIKPKLRYSFELALGQANDVTAKGCKPH